MSFWSDHPESKAYVAKLWDEGYSTRQIADRVNLNFRHLGVSATKNSIVGLVHRLGLPGRPSPIKNHGDPSIAKKRAATWKARQEMGATQFSLAVKKSLPPLESEKIKAPPVAVPAPPKPSAHVRAGSPCCYPMEQVGRYKWTYCDEPTQPGRSYCDMHHAVTHTRVPQDKKSPIQWWQRAGLGNGR